MNKRPLVGIVIVNWNKKDITAGCLKSLKMTSYPNYKVILVDNGSTDGSVEYLKKVNPKMHILKLKRNYGYTEGTNVGWRYALDKLKADYICAMDNDIVTTQKNWLDLVINELEKSPSNGIGSGKHVFPDGKLQLPFIGADQSDDYKPDTGKYNFIKEVDSFYGPSIVIKREVIEKIGCYDENFFYGPNDIDYCRRAKKAGFKSIYVGTSSSIHLGSATGKSPFRQKDFMYRNQAEGMLIYGFRYEPFFLKMRLILYTFFRAFITKRDSHKNLIPLNLFFYPSFPKRLVYFFISLVKSLNRYNHIKTSDTQGKIAQ